MIPWGLFRVQGFYSSQIPPAPLSFLVTLLMVLGNRPIHILSFLCSVEYSIAPGNCNDILFVGTTVGIIYRYPGRDTNKLVSQDRVIAHDPHDE